MDELINLLKDMSNDMVAGDKGNLNLIEQLINEHNEMKLVILQLTKSVAMHSEILRIMIDAAGAVATEYDKKDVH